MIPMVAILDHFNHPYKGVPGQCPCPVHKGGKETKFSAKLFEDGLYCYTCSTQYRPSQIFEALSGATSRADAAHEMLRIWPVSKVEADKVLKDYTTPKKVTVSQAYYDNARQALLVYKLKVPLDKYMKWSIALEKLPEVLVEATDLERKLKLESFKGGLARELGSYLRK
jgi:hypothetical protein